MTLASGPVPHVWAAPTTTAPAESSDITSRHLAQLDLSSLTIPEQLGRVVETWQPQGQVPNGLVIHLQDLHTHPGAQQNLSELIGYLHDQFGVELVALEGAEGLCDTSPYSDFPDPSSTQRIARLFLKEGLFTGAEYYAITHPGHVTLWGVEDEPTYLEHLTTYRQGAARSAQAEAVLTQLRDALSSLRVTLYPKTLQKLLKLREAYERGTDNAFQPYLTELQRLAKKQIRPSILTRELESLEEAVEQAHFTTEQQRALARLAKQVELLDDLIHVKLSPRRLRDYHQHRAVLTADTLWSLLQQVIHHQSPRTNHQSLVTKADLERLLQDLPTQERFYALALKRDGALIRNTVRQLEHQPTKAAILIAGGFHTPGLTQQLKAHQVAYAVMTPKTNGEFDESRYQASLRNAIPPITELIQQLDQQALIAGRPFGNTASKLPSRLIVPPEVAPDRKAHEVELAKDDATFLTFLMAKIHEYGKQGIEHLRAAVEWMQRHPQVAARGIILTWAAGKLIVFAMGIETQFSQEDGMVLAMAAVGSVGKEEPAPQPAPETVRKNLKASEYADATQRFSGVDLEHFVHAQYRLARQRLSEDALRQLLSSVGLDPRLTGEPAYQVLSERLADGRYTKEVVDFINADTYADPELVKEAIGYQNPNPKAQGVYEAVANSLDALGLSIGQFGKGVKQIIDWLEPTGEDRIDVLSRQGEVAYQLTILQDPQSQLYIQIKKLLPQDFQQVAGHSATQGTVVRVTVRDPLPRTDQELDPTHRNSQEGLAAGIHRQFAYVPSVDITTQLGDHEPRQVNGFGEKVVIVPADAPPYAPAERAGKAVRVIFTDHTITMIDNGTGMDAQILARMFAPKAGTKHPEPFSGQAAHAALAKVTVVHDRSLPHRVSFSRNGRIAVAIDIPQDIQEPATIPGGLMIEFGGPLNVPESWDAIRIPLDLKPGERSNFQLAVEHAVTQLIAHPSLSAVEKLRTVNTLMVGLDGLEQGNPNYGHVIRAIRANAQTALAGTIAQLRREGFLILPHNASFAKLAIPEGKRALFVHEHLFQWQGAVSLKELGGEIVPGITLGGDQRLPLVVVPFTPESLHGVSQFNPLWHTWPETERNPVIKTDRFIAIPKQHWQRFLELATKRVYGRLSPQENEDFPSLAQRVNILTASQVATTYEVTQVKPQMAVVPLAEVQQSVGEIDSHAINGFLTTPPVVVGQGRHPETSRAPPDANQRHIVLENGDLVEVGTSRRIRGDVQELVPLTNGYYKLKTKLPRKADVITRIGADWYELVKLDAETEIVALSMPAAEGDIVISPDQRFAYVRRADGTADGMFSLAEGQEYFLGPDFSPIQVAEGNPPQPSSYSNLQFSRDGKYLTYLEKSSDLFSPQFVTVDLQQKRIVDKENLAAWDLVMDVEYALNPFANVAFVRRKGLLLHGQGRAVEPSDPFMLLDLETGKFVGPRAKHLHTDSAGAYTAIVDQNGEMSVYLHKAKQLLTSDDFGGQRIHTVVTYWQETGPFFEVTLEGGSAGFRDDGRRTVLDRRSLGSLYYEEFRLDGTVSLVSHLALPTRPGIEPVLLVEPVEVNPLQRLEGKGAYKHTHFELFIDHSDPAHPVAVDPRTGQQFQYRGEVIFYRRDLQQLVTSDHGEIYELSPGGREHRIGKAVFSEVGSTLHVVERETAQQWATYPFYEYGPHRYASGGLSSPLSYRNYPSVTFDGKYFVFVNPRTGDVIYLDPERQEQPISVPVAQPAAPASPFLDTKPADAPNRFVIVASQEGRFGINDVESGVMVEDFLLGGHPVSRIERVNPNAFIVYHDGGLFQVFKMKRNPDNTTKFALEWRGKSSSSDKVVSHTEKVIVVEFLVEKLQGGQRIQQALIDVATGDRYPDPAKGASSAVHISASGRFSVHVTETGGLVYYDHDEASPSQKVIARGGEYQEYLVSDRADAVITKDARGLYSVYSLLQEHYVMVDEDHVEIDSSGTIAIGKDAHGLGYVNLKTGQFGQLGGPTGLTTRPIRVAADEERIYVSWSAPGNTHQVYSKYDKKDGSWRGGGVFGDPVLKSDGDVSLPRFWESYGLGQKTIWDRETNGKPEILQRQVWAWNGETSYRANPPTAPTATSVLFGKTVVVDQRVDALDEEANPQIFYLEAVDDSGVSGARLGRETRTLQSLQGGKILYAAVKEETPPFFVVRPADLSLPFEPFSEAFDAGFVNQSKAFILAQRRQASVLIAADGTVTDLTNRIPTGFVPTDVNGDYFVFTNPQTGEVKYLDPRAISAQPKAQEPSVETAESAEQKARALELWNAGVFAKRDAFIAQARAAYQPFLALIPEAFRGEIERLIQPAIEPLYRRQEQELQARFQHAVASDQPVDLTSPLPFDEFQRRMDLMRAELEQFLAYGSEVIDQEEVQTRRTMYRHLFVNLFQVGVSQDLDPAQLQADALHAVAFGWEISRQDQLDDATLIAAFYQALSQFRTGPPLGIPEAMKLVSFLSHISAKGPEQHQVLIKQLKKLMPDVSDPSHPAFEATMTKRLGLLTKLRESFQRVELDALIAYLDHPEGSHNLGEAKPFAVFLSHEVEPVREQARVIPAGEDVHLPDGGVSLSQIMNLELERPNKQGPEDVMDMDYLLAHIEADVAGRETLPALSEEGEAEVLQNATVQRESGAYTAEIAQNSRDAKATELVVDFYLQRNEATGRTEYVEEVRDDGPGALKAVALLIPKSLKTEGEQMEETGFFGTGKYTIFEGVDRVEILTKHQDRAYLFTLTVLKADGTPTAIRLTGIRRITDPAVAQGVTVRRIKLADNTIPELDQMLAQRAWKTFAGLSQHEGFHIDFIDHEGNRQPLQVEHEILSQTEFKAIKPRERQPTTFGALRIISTKDMPLQVVDRAGFRVTEIKEAYVALIPPALRPHLKELGINFQIPLPLTRGRSAFEHEAELPVIQRTVAIEFYKAIAYRTLTRTSPQFVFENFPADWETNEYYWESLEFERPLALLAEKINRGQYEAITEQELKDLFTKPGMLDNATKSLKLILLLEAPTDHTKPAERVSLLGRKRKLAFERGEREIVEAQERRLRRAGLTTFGDVRSVQDIPDYAAKLAQAEGIKTAHEQMRDPERYLIDPNLYSEKEKGLVRLAFSAAEQFGLEQVLLVSDEVRFAGAFTRYRGRHTMLLNQSLAHDIGRPDPRFAIIDKATDTIVHELAHLLEERARRPREDGVEELWREGFVSLHAAGTTHHRVGRFAQAMKYAAALWRADHEPPAATTPATPSVAPPSGPGSPGAAGSTSETQAAQELGGAED